jgi:hypothetical protein
VLIIVAAGGGPTVVAAVDLDVRRLPQDHLSFVARSITVMIKARVMRHLALLGRPTMMSSPASCGASIISCLTTLRSGVGSESASRPVSRSGAGCSWEPGQGRRDRRSLEVVCLARVKIDQSHSWTMPTFRLDWSQSSDVRRIVVLPGAAALSAVYRVWRPLAGQGSWPPSQWFRSRDFKRSVKAGKLQRCHSSKASLVKA